MKNKTMAKKAGVSDRLMDGAVGFGKFQIWVGIILFGIISALCLFFGIWYLVSEDVPVEKGKAVVDADSVCQYVHSGDSSDYVCTTTVSYQVNGKDYNIPIKSNVKHLKGNEVNIEWEKGAPGSAMLCCRTKNSTIGFALIGIGIFCGGGAALNYYFRNNEFYAAASGASFFLGR